MLVPNRHGSSESYRYGFGGEEKDDEIKGEGNFIAYADRGYDPRIGRFISIDAFANAMPSYSPYSYALNNPIFFVDEDGNWPKPSDFLPKNTPPMLKGLVDGVWEGLTGTAGFAYDYATDSKFREQVNQSFTNLISDPIGTLQPILDAYAGKIERLATGNATDEDIYDINAEIGEAGVGLLLGGATLGVKALKKVAKPDISASDVAKKAKEDVKAKRPSWQKSEADALSGTDYAKQKSFKDGEEVPYGTKGSVRPEGYKASSSLEVKNYKLNSQGINNLVNNVSKQINQRVKNLPANTTQNIVIDIRGQNVTKETMKSIVDKISKKVETKNYNIVFKTK